jgi:DNA-binding transcriptional LysR family regulator
MNVTLRQLRAFVLVGRLGSFTKAADALHVTQSALSLLIRDLENVIGTRLVDRTTRNVSLTSAGSEFFASTARILEELAHAIGNVDQLIAKERGRVVIAAPLVLSSTLLPPILAGFKAAYPGVDLVLNDSLPGEVLPQVRNGTADLGIGTFSPSEEGLNRVLLMKEAMVAVFPASHAFARVSRLTWRDLADVPVLALRRGSVFRDLAQVGFAAIRMPLTPAFEADYVGSLIGMAGANLGVAIVPGYATALGDRKRIQWRRLEKPLVEREILMVHRAGPTLAPAAKAFAEFVMKPGVLPAAGGAPRSRGAR